MKCNEAETYIGAGSPTSFVMRMGLTKLF